MYGKHHTKEAKEKIGKAFRGKNSPNYGRHPSKESREKMSKAQLSKKNWHSVPVIQYDLNGNFIKKWDCMADIERELGIHYQNISNCCMGKQKTCHGYIWKYYKENEE